MDALHVALHYHVTERSSGGGRGSSGAVGPLFIVLAIIMVLGVLAGFIGRVCSGRHWGGDTQYDFEGWVEKRCANCIEGDIEAPPPPPPPSEKPPDPAAPPPEVSPPADSLPAAAPADAPPPAANPAPDPAKDAPAEGPKSEAPAEEQAPAPAEPLPPPPPPPPEEAGPAAPPTQTEPLTYTMLYPSYSCSCHICAREGIFE